MNGAVFVVECVMCTTSVILMTLYRCVKCLKCEWDGIHSFIRLNDNTIEAEKDVQF